MTSQRSLKTQLALSELTTRSIRLTAIFRYAIHHANSDIEILNSHQLRAGASLFAIEKSKLVVTDESHRKTTLVEGVGDMRLSMGHGGVDVSVVVASGAIRRVIHVFTAFS